MGAIETVAAEQSKSLDEIILQFMTPELEGPVLAFKSRYLGSRGGAAFTNWKFRQGPVDCRDCVLIAIANDGSIVGHLAAVVFPTVPGCKVPWLALGTEFIVDENYRGGKHDIIRKMDVMLGERLAQKGVELLFGTPNKPGYLVAKRLYRRADGPKCILMSKIFTPAFWLPQGAVRKGFHRLISFSSNKLLPLPVGWSWDSVDTFLKADINDFCQEFMRNIEFGACRDADFLNWRYGGGDGFTYERIRLVQGEKLMGLAVLRIHPSRCEAASLMEFMALDPIGYNHLLLVCLQLARRRAPMLQVMGMIDSPANGIYLQHGFRSNSEILSGIIRGLAWIPGKVRKILVQKAENHFDVDNYLTVYYYPDPNRSKEFAKGRWYLTLAEKFGF